MSNALPSKIRNLLKEEFQFEEQPFFGQSGNEALIIVDVQNDFLTGGALEVPGGDEIIPVINRLQENFDLIVLTQDWHPRQHQSFFSSHEGKRPYESVDLEGIAQVLWPEHCIQGTFGAEFSSLLHTDKASMIIRKGTMTEIDSYSAFYDNGRKNSTGLTGFLLEKLVRKVSICGLAGDYCVFYSAMDALHQGFEVEIVRHASKAIDPLEFEEKLKEFEAAGGKIGE